MKKFFFIALLFISGSSFAQGQLQKEASNLITYASGKVIQLAEAIPAEKFDWRPADGSRSFAETFAHVISANYYFASKIGAQIPAGVNMQTLEKDLKNKEQINSALKQSYDVLLQAIKNSKDEKLKEKVEFPFPGEFTQMTSILIGLSHNNEHLGQLIAYARMNKITPPWSVNGGE